MAGLKPKPLSAGKSGLLAGIAARTVAPRNGFRAQRNQFIDRKAGLGGNLEDGIQQRGADQTVVVVTAIAPGRYQPGFPQYHQVLGDDRLAKGQDGFEVANADLLITDSEEDLDADGLAQQVEYFSQSVGGVG